MKIKISFTLDLSKTSYNINNRKGISESLCSLTQWLQQLHTHFLQQNVYIVSNFSLTEEDKNNSLAWNKERVELASQIFNDLKIEGLTEDKNQFEFTHTEPNYVEHRIVNGVDVECF